MNSHRLEVPKYQRIDIEFRDLTYRASVNRKEKKSILKGISGQFKSGEMTAIMGPSGAGKTTLLNILTGYHFDIWSLLHTWSCFSMLGLVLGKCEGFFARTVPRLQKTEGLDGVVSSITSESTSIGQNSYKKECCYILQDDQLSPFFTIYESMQMAADFKLGTSQSTKHKNILINDILNMLSLTDVKDTRCDRLSGGQKKRLSVALELIDNPPIMFLDEPTTGLDVSSASKCISMLRVLAVEGRTIICTIHQPCAILYDMFDHVYALADGKCIYKGHSKDTVNYLAGLGFFCPQYHNPADFLLEVANKEYGDFTDFLATKAEQIQRCHITKEKDSDIYIESCHHSKKTTPSEWYKFKVLLKRSFLQLYRDWTISHLRIVMHFLVGVVLGTMYYKVGNDGSKTLTNAGYLIITCVYLIYTALMPAVLKFPSELAILKKERFNNWYNLKTYYVAFMVSDIPIQSVFTLAYIGVSYLLTDQPLDAIRFGMVLTVLILTTLASSSLGLLIGTLLNPVDGTFIGAIFTALFLSVAGFLAFFSHMPTFLYIFSYVSYISYAYEGVINAIYGFGRQATICPDYEDYCHYKDPTQFMKETGLNRCSYRTDILFLVGYIIVMRTLAYCTLKRRLASLN